MAISRSQTPVQLMTDKSTPKGTNEASINSDRIDLKQSDLGREPLSHSIRALSRAESDTSDCLNPAHNGFHRRLGTQRQGAHSFAEERAKIPANLQGNSVLRNRSATMTAFREEEVPRRRCCHGRE